MPYYVVMGIFFIKFKVYNMDARYTYMYYVVDYVLVSTIMLLAFVSIQIIIKIIITFFVRPKI